MSIDTRFAPEAHSPAVAHASHLQTAPDESTEQAAFERYQHQNHIFPGVLPTWHELEDSSALKIIYRTVHAHPYRHQLFGGTLDVKGNDPETALHILEGIVGGLEAAGQFWQVTRFNHVPPRAHRGHLYIHIEWGTPGFLPGQGGLS